MKKDRALLEHMLDCIVAIRQYGGMNRSRFFEDRKTRKATLRELQELAESSKRLSEEVTSRRSDIAWSGIAGFRNVLVHDYLGLELERIWSVIERDLPVLEAALHDLLGDS